MISDVGTVGTNTVYNDTNTVSVTVGRDIPVGAVLVIWLATNSIHGFSDDEALGWMFAYDTKGNFYSSVASAENGVTFYYAGAMGQIIVTQLFRALESGDVITCWCAQPDQNAGPHNDQVTVKAMSVREFDFGGLAWAASGEAYTVSKVTTAADPVSFDKSLGSVQDWLCLHALCSEGPDTDTYTWDSDYTQIAGTGATGTGVDVHVRGGFAIASAASSTPTVDVSSATDRRHVQLLTGICGVRPRTFTDALPLVDDFNRANEDPADGGIWNPYPSSYGFNKAKVVSNRLEGSGGSQTLEQYYGDCQSVYATLADDGTYPTSLQLALGVTGDASTATFLGHVAIWEQYQAYFSGYRPLSLSYGREFGVSAIKPPLWSNAGGPVVGSKWGIQLRRPEGDEGFQTRLWVDPNNGDGWRPVGAIVWRYNHPYPSGAFGAGVGDSANGAIDNIYGGDVPCGQFRPQVYRRQFGVA